MVDIDVLKIYLDLKENLDVFAKNFCVITISKIFNILWIGNITFQFLLH